MDTRTPWTVDRTSDDPARHLLFYVGSHMPRWMETSTVPLFVSARTLDKYRVDGDPFPKSRCLVSIDSGGFTELQKFGRWTMDEDTYGGMIYRFMDNGIVPKFVAPQDWMCEPAVIKGGKWGPNTFAGTGLSVQIHQELTIENFLYLRDQFTPPRGCRSCKAGPSTSTSPTRTSTPPQGWTSPPSPSSVSGPCAAASPPTKSASSPPPSPPAATRCTASA